MNQLRSLAVALLFTSALAGCSSTPPAGSTASPKAVSPTKQGMGTTLPDEVKDLRGTASFLERSPEITAALKNPPAPGAYFLLLDPQDIVKAVVVYAGPTIKPEELARRKSGNIMVSGPVKKVSAPDFKKMIKEKYQIDLTSSGDDIQIVMAEGEIFPAAASPTPGVAPVTSSPAAGK